MIDFYWGLPSEGKTFVVVKKEREKIIKGRIVYSNFPIMFVHKGKQYSSLVWNDKYVYEPLHDCDIVIDEGYRTASSRDWKSFTVDEHTFYATTGHNGIDVLFITQAIPRVEVIIREIVSKFHQIKKFSIPWFKPDPRGEYEKVIWFLEEVRLQSPKTPGTPADEIYTSSRLFFDKNTAKAYDTKYYRKPGELSFKPEFWTQKLEIKQMTKPDGIVETWLKNRKKTSTKALPLAKVEQPGAKIPPKKSQIVYTNKLPQIRLPKIFKNPDPLNMELGRDLK